MLTGLPLLLALVATALGVCWATAALWLRWSGPRATAVRAGMLLLVMASGAVVTFDAVNRQYGFYTSVGELFGGTAVASAPRSPGSAVDAATFAAGRRDALAGHGTVLRVELDGVRSHLHRAGYVYLPAAWFTDPSARFAGVELLHGAPGGPGNWLKQMHVASTLDEEIAAGRLPPVVAVMPQYARRGGRECLDTRSSAEETYLAVDVPALLDRELRVQSSNGSWATMGYSTGANCAVSLAAHHPGTYSAAVSIAGDLPSRARYQTLAETDLVSTPRTVPSRWPALFLMSSRQDRASTQGLYELAHAAAGHTVVTTDVLPVGGHNWNVWHAASVPALDWLGSFLPAPLAPPRVDPHQVTTGPATGPARRHTPTATLRAAASSAAARRSLR